MLKQNIFLLTVFTLLYFKGYSQTKEIIAENFMTFLNSYNTNELKEILSDSFRLKRGFVNYQNDKKSFLENYLPYSKEIKAKFISIENYSEKNQVIYLVRDISDYLKYLEVKSPTWKISISFTNDLKVNYVIIDATETFAVYKSELQLKDKKFTNWLKNKQVRNYEDALQTGKGLESLLKAYYKSNHK